MHKAFDLAGAPPVQSLSTGKRAPTAGGAKNESGSKFIGESPFLAV